MPYFVSDRRQWSTTPSLQVGRCQVNQGPSVPSSTSPSIVQGRERNRELVRTIEAKHRK